MTKKQKYEGAGGGSFRIAFRIVKQMVSLLLLEVSLLFSVILLTGCSCSRQDLQGTRPEVTEQTRIPGTEEEGGSKEASDADPGPSEGFTGSDGPPPSGSEEEPDRSGEEKTSEKTEPGTDEEDPIVTVVLDYSVTSPNLIGYRIGDRLDPEDFTGVASLPKDAPRDPDRFYFEPVDAAGTLMTPVTVLSVRPETIPSERFQAEVTLEGLNGETVVRSVNCKLFGFEGSTDGENDSEKSSETGEEDTEKPDVTAADHEKTTTPIPFVTPTKLPAITPSVIPTKVPTPTPAVIPTNVPTITPSAAPDKEPTPTFSVTPATSPTPTVIPEESVTSVFDPYWISRAAFDHINEYRKEQGVDPIPWDEGVYRLLLIRLSELEQDYSHREAFADQVGSFIWEGRSYGFHTGSECIDRARPDEYSAVNDWKNSPEHNRILLREGTQEHFCGAAAIGENGYAVFTVMDLDPFYQATMEECWELYDSGTWADHVDR